MFWEKFIIDMMGTVYVLIGILSIISSIYGIMIAFKFHKLLNKEFKRCAKENSKDKQETL